MNSSPKARAVLFDLDGTLADTAPDLTDALNELLMQHGKQKLPYERVQKYVSQGSVAMLKLGFGESLKESHINELRDNFFNFYDSTLCNKTKLFPDVPDLLDSLDRASIPWGIVTNKPSRFVEPLLLHLDIATRTICTVCGDTLLQSKPSPEPLHHAANLIGIDESECIYIGDDPRDVHAGTAANMTTAVAAYGYVEDEQDPHSWGADYVLENPLQLKDWLLPHK